MPSQAEIEQFQQDIGELSVLAVAEVAATITAAMVAGQPLQALVKAMPAVLEPYMVTATELAMHWYRGLARTTARPASKLVARQPIVGPTGRVALLDAAEFQPRPAQLPPREQIESTAWWALSAAEPVSSAKEPDGVRVAPADEAGDRAPVIPAAPGQARALSRMAGATQRFVTTAARDTITENAEREDVRWARHARRDACAFCRLLATRGPQYQSKKSARFVGTGRVRGPRKAGEKYHDDCECEPVPVRAGDSYDPPDYIDDWADEYEAAAAASNGTLKSILHEMRKNDIPRDRTKRAGEELAAEIRAPTGVLTLNTFSALESARASLPLGREGWERTTHGPVQRPAETRLERAIWELVQKVTATDAELAEIYKDPAIAPFEGSTWNDRSDRRWALKDRIEELDKKLARARAATSIEKLSAQLETARQDSAQFEAFTETLARHEGFTADLDRKTNNPPTGDVWRQMQPELRDDYAKDSAGNLLPTNEMNTHLDTVLDVGRRIRADIHRSFDADPELVGLVGKKRALREAEQVLRALAEIRTLGGHEQQATATRWSDLQDLREVERLYPKEWLEAADQRGPLTIDVADRAHFSPIGPNGGDLLAANRDNYDYNGSFDSHRQEVMAHELGHRMEHSVPGLTHLEYALVRRRGMTSGQLESLARLYPGKEEFAYADRWANAYTGKVYDNKITTDPASMSHEVFQVGIQQTFGRFRKYGDEELEGLVLGALALL